MIPVATGDGRLIELKNFSIDARAVHGSKNGNSGELLIGRATGMVEWNPGEIGPTAKRYLEGRGHDLTDRDQKLELHIRSFLARSGLDGVIRSVEFIEGSLVAELDFEFLVDRAVHGEQRFPLFDGLEKQSKAAIVRVAQLVFVPNEAKPLNEEGLQRAIAAGELKLPKGWSFDPRTQQVSLPLNGEQYSVGTVRSLDGGDWSDFFRAGKRALLSLQSKLTQPGNMIRPGFDVREIEVSGQEDYRLLLSRETSHPRVAQTASPLLAINDTAPRHVELRTDHPSVPAGSIRSRASVYVRDERERTAISLSTSHSLEATRIETSLSSTSLDTLMQRESVVSRYVELVKDFTRTGIHGVVVGPSGAYVVPFDHDNSWQEWAVKAAKSGEPLDERILGRISLETLRALRDAEGARALSSILRESQAAHYMTHIYVSRTLPSPYDMHHLARNSGAGIGTFLASELRQPAHHERSPHAVNSLHRDWLEQYRRFTEDGSARIYWLPKEGEVRKMVGPTFIKLGLVPFYKNLDLVVGVYCSHLDLPEFNQSFEEQIPAFIAGLNDLGGNIGVVTGASSGLMTKLAQTISGFSNVQPMGISTLFSDQTPDLTPGILTIFPGGELRDRQRLLARSGDVRIALNGGIGSTSEIVDDLLDMKGGFLLPGPVGVIDMAKIGNWEKLVGHIQLVSELPKGKPLTPEWLKGLLHAEDDLRKYTREQLFPFLYNPLEWMESRGVPQEVQIAGLRSHVRHTTELGRPPANFLRAALERFGIE